MALVAAGFDDKEPHTECQVPINVYLYGLSASHEDFDVTKAVQDIADYTGINNLTVAVYNGSTDVVKVTQSREETSSYETFAFTRLANIISNNSAMDVGAVLNRQA